MAVADDDKDEAFADDLPCRPMAIMVTSKSADNVNAVDDLFIPVSFLHNYRERIRSRQLPSFPRVARFEAKDSLG